MPPLIILLLLYHVVSSKECPQICGNVEENPSEKSSSSPFKSAWSRKPFRAHADSRIVNGHAARDRG